MIEIDGSYGEGGGSIVRLAVAFSAVTGKSCRIFNIRSGREKVGLQPQHLTAVKAAAEISNAKVKGLVLGSREIEFYPSSIRGGRYDFDVGTAGATTLVMQALMIPAYHSEKALEARIKGGTIVRWSPTIGYLQNVTLPLLRKLNYNADVEIAKHGFYPRGGGLIGAKIWPSKLKAYNFAERGKLKDVVVEVTSSQKLKERKVAERMVEAIQEDLEEKMKMPITKINYVNTLSDGVGIDIYAIYEHSILGANALGEIKKKAEDVATEALRKILSLHESKATLDEHMADQILPYLALASGNSRIKVAQVTRHAETNIWLLQKFINWDFSVKGNLIEVVK
ncbi:MAG: RNA 3'-terminal phosphate cyclase [Nanoarchaeota archaeon]